MSTNILALFWFKKKITFVCFYFRWKFNVWRSICPNEQRRWLFLCLMLNHWISDLAFFFSGLLSGLTEKAEYFYRVKWKETQRGTAAKKHCPLPLEEYGPAQLHTKYLLFVCQVYQRYPLNMLSRENIISDILRFPFWVMIHTGDYWTGLSVIFSFIKQWLWLWERETANLQRWRLINPLFIIISCGQTSMRLHSDFRPVKMVFFQFDCTNTVILQVADVYCVFIKHKYRH